MKKLLIATAVAATMATGAQAASTTYNVSSNITAVGLYLGDLDLMTAEAPGYITGFNFGGTATDADNDGDIDSSSLTLTGIQGFTVNALPIRLTYNLSSGSFVQGSGVTFTGGNILIEVQTTEGYTPYGTIDAATTNLPFLGGQPGHWAANYPTQTTTGLQLVPGTTALPGLWDQIAESGSFNNGVAALTLLGQTSGMYLEGELHLDVPVPGAAWMFGSAVLGLAGASRKRKAAKA
jgi:hypothetical protein